MKQRICELCAAPIPEVWITDELLGTCPSCKRLAHFILPDENLQKIEEDNKKRENDELRKEQERILLEEYQAVYEVDGKIRINNVNLAKLIMNETGYSFITIEDVSTGKQEIYYYDGGYYHAGGNNRINELVQYYLDDLSSSHRKNEVVGYIQDTNHFFRRDIEPPVNLINVKNGVYDLNTDKLMSHSPDLYFLNQVPVNYNPNASCPKIKEFFNQVIYKKFIPTMQEMFGFVLYRDYFLHRAFMLLGGGRNGKGVTIQLMEKFIGYGNYSTRGLHELIEDKFAKESLYGKLANLGAELSYRAIKETDVFKNLTGGEPITGEKKFHGAFPFKNYAKLIFNTNQLLIPKYDKTKAYFDRWIIFNFPETFDMDDDRTNPNIINEISTQNELEGLLLWAIDGLKRLIKRNKFTYEVEEDCTGDYYESLVKPEIQFFKEYLCESQNSEVDKDMVYNYYVDWAKERSYAVLSKGALTRKMKEHFKEFDIKDTRRNNKKVKLIMHVAWNTDKVDIGQTLQGDFGNNQIIWTEDNQK